MRIVITLQNLTQLNKLIWGQLECFTATVVANAPIIWGLYRHARNQTSSAARSAYALDQSSQGPQRPGYAARGDSKGPTITSAIRMNRVSKNNYSSWVKLQDEALTASDANSNSSSRPFGFDKGGGIERTVEVRQESNSIDEERDTEGNVGVVRTAIYGFDDDRRH